MKSLADLLNFVVSTLQASPLFAEVHVLETQQFSDTQFTFKARAKFRSRDVLQIRLYINGEHIDYAYQLLDNDHPLERWDNKEHFPAVPSFPHHFHNSTGSIETSPLTGDPAHDLPMVLIYLEKLSH